MCVLTSPEMTIVLTGSPLFVYKLLFSRYLQAKFWDNLWIFLGLTQRQTLHMLFWCLHSYHLPRALHRKWETGLFYAWISKVYLGIGQRKEHRVLFSNIQYHLLHSMLFLLTDSYSLLGYVERQCEEGAPC